MFSSITRVTAITCFLVTLGDSYAETPRYHPTVGATFEYGIEFWVVEQKKKKGHLTIDDRQRCRVIYSVTQSDDQGWQANYETIPYRRTKRPSSRESYERSVQSVRERAAGTDPISVSRQKSSMRSIDPIFDRVRKMGDAIRKELARIEALKVDGYPGLFQYCSGSIRVASDAKVTEMTGPGSLPFAFGHVARFALIRLPKDSLQASFSFREVNKLKLYFGEVGKGQYRDTEQQVISVMTPRKASAPELVAFNRDMDQTGGGTAGAGLVVSGKGFCEFSTKQGMPHSGNLDFDSEGFTYVGYGNKFKLRLGFHVLNSWRGELFDNGLLPIESGLDPENLPRLSSKQQSALRSWWGSSNPSKSVEYQTVTMRSAPVAFGSSTQAKMDEYLEEMKSRPSGTMDFAQRSQLSNTEQMAKRWTKLRELAKVVPRQWSDTSESFSVTARMQSFQDDTVTLIRVDSGKPLRVPVDRLSEEDAEFAKTFGVPELL